MLDYAIVTEVSLRRESLLSDKRKLEILRSLDLIEERDHSLSCGNLVGSSDNNLWAV